MRAEERDEGEAARLEGMLVERAQRGDGLAFRQLVAPHLPMLLRLCARSVGDRNLAEDAVQEALLLAYERLGRLKSGVRFRAFLAGIAVKRAKTLLRSAKRRAHRELAAEKPQGLVAPHEAKEAEELAVALREALARLPRKRREALIMRLDGGLDYGEIAQVLGSSEASVRGLVHLGIGQLRDMLDRKPGFEDLLPTPVVSDRGRV